MNAYYKNIMWAASRLATSIRDGHLPADYKTGSDYHKPGGAGNPYQNAEFTGDVYPFTGGVKNIHAGLVGMSRVGLIIALRATDGDDTIDGNVLDRMNNFLANQVSFQAYGRGQVHMGFLIAVQSIMEGLIYKTRELLSAAGVKETVIYVTGHSKGGAMAAIMAKILQNHFKNRIIVYSFGAPRVGNREFRESYGLLHYRYESFLDAVCHVPFSEQEIILIKRMSTLYEILDVFTMLPAYYPVGTGICIYKPRGEYGRLPYDTHNPYEEKLNSFCAVEEMLRVSKLDFNLISDIHRNDYYD